MATLLPKLGPMFRDIHFFSSVFLQRRWRLFTLSFGLLLFTFQGCRCCPNSFISSQPEGTLTVTLGSDTTPVQFDVSNLRAILKVDACYGRVTLRRVQLVFDPSSAVAPNAPDKPNPEMTRAEILTQLRQKNYIEIPVLRLPLAFEQCERQDPQAPLSARCHLSTNPNEKTQETLNVELGDPKQYPPQLSQAWRVPCQLAAQSAQGLAKRPTLLFFSGFLEDNDSSYTVPPAAGRFMLTCK